MKVIFFSDVLNHWTLSLALILTILIGDFGYEDHTHGQVRQGMELPWFQDDSGSTAPALPEIYNPFGAICPRVVTFPYTIQLGTIPECYDI
jgi:hypothetical protein